MIDDIQNKSADCNSSPTGDMSYNPARKRVRGRTFVYFIGPKDRSLARVKIGFTSTTPNERKASLQGSSPFELEVYAFFYGNEKDERQLQKAFGLWNSHNEWFHCAGPLAEMLRQVELISTTHPIPKKYVCEVAKRIVAEDWTDEVNSLYFGGFVHSFPSALSNWSKS